MADQLSRLLPERELHGAHFGYRSPQLLQDLEVAAFQKVGLLRILRPLDLNAPELLDWYPGNSNHPESPLYKGQFRQLSRHGFYVHESQRSWLALALGTRQPLHLQ